jgi:hypothetical protein
LCRNRELAADASLARVFVRRLSSRLAERASLISSYDFEHEQDGAKHKKQNADSRRAGVFERHADGR